MSSARVTRAGDQPVQLNIENWTGFIGQWDDRTWNERQEAVQPRPGQTLPPGAPRARAVSEFSGLLIPGFIKRADVVWYISHRHAPDGSNEPHAYAYLFAYPIDVPAGVTTLTLPHNDRIRILAISVADDAGQDPTMQTRELKEYCQRRGWQEFDCYADNGVSGKKDSRPHLNRMMQDAHERRFDVVVVMRFDRFARSVSHLLRALETFNSLGVQFVSLSEQVDTSTPTGKMVFTVLGAVAELERNLIVERVRAGLRHARAKGKRLGRPKKSIDPVQIASLRAAGHSWRKIAREMGVSVGTVFAAAQGSREITHVHRPQTIDFS